MKVLFRYVGCALILIKHNFPSEIYGEKWTFTQAVEMAIITRAKSHLKVDGLQSLIRFCSTEITLPYWFLVAHLIQNESMDSCLVSSVIQSGVHLSFNEDVAAQKTVLSHHLRFTRSQHRWIFLLYR